jgi:outer membrane protein OmpA-like peptidoglycan-associated protein
MSKHKPATASKRVRRPKMVAKAQRARQAIVRGPRSSSLRVSTQSPAERPTSLRQDEPLVEDAVAAQDDLEQAVRDQASRIGFDLSSSAASMRAYQGKLLEIAQANIQFAFESAQRFGTIGSPVGFLKVIEELTSKRIEMFRKHSKEIAELTIRR